MAIAKIGKTIMKSLFGKPATLMYPVRPREWKERTRGHIEIDVNACILCSICDRKCPTNAITVDRNARSWAIERMQCIQCSCCVEVCPKKCLVNKNEYTTPETHKIVDTFEIPAPAPKAPSGDDAAPAAPAAPTDGELTCDDTCIFCGICAKKCPVDAIEVNRTEKMWTVNRDTCIKCGVCVEACPKKSLSFQ